MPHIEECNRGGLGRVYTLACNEDNRWFFEMCGVPMHSSWAEVLEDALRTFSEGRADEDMREIVAYRLLLSLSENLLTWKDYQRSLQGTALRAIYRSSIIEQIYQWAMPHLESVWRQMPAARREIYLGILRHGEWYLTSFDYARERAYLHELELGHCRTPQEHLTASEEETARDGFEASPCTWQFVVQGPDGEINPYRKLEAFFFRRAHEGVPVDVMLGYLRRVIRELETP